MLDKAERQKELLNVLKAEVVRDQHDAVRIMCERGIEVTQPSISRDFRELGVVKIDGRYVAGGLALTGAAIRGKSSGLEALVKSIDSVGVNLVVVKTEAGGANIIGAAVDAGNIAGVVGTVAGDDTVFIATRNSQAQKLLRRYLEA